MQRMHHLIMLRVYTNVCLQQSEDSCVSHLSPLITSVENCEPKGIGVSHMIRAGV